MSANNSPLLLLSSGRRPRYLEDIVRALALPDGGHIQFRYHEELLADGVKKYFAEHGLMGHTCYLAYVDTGTPGKKPEIVPVREAVVIAARKLGGSFIFVMRTVRYIRTNELPTILASIENSAQDRLPTWRPDHSQHPEKPLNGYWVNFLNSPLSDTQLTGHDAEEGSHLDLFQTSVNNLCRHRPDFAEPSRQLFFNILAVKASSGAPVPLVNGGWQLAPSREYRLDLYHYSSEEGPLTERPVFWLNCRASGGVTVLGRGVLTADSSYDSHTLTLQTVGALRRTQSAISISRTTNPKDDAASTAELVFNVEVGVELKRNIAQAVLIGFFIALAALITDFDRLSLLKGLLILAAGFAAGFASVFKFARTP